MNMTRDRLRSIGWAMVLVICTALTLALTFRVNAVKSQVRLAERQIVALRHEKMFLETEFETRANQQQLKALNDVEFGYEAPTSGQYLESERQLASLGKERGPGAPSPIRVASAADVEEAGIFPAMVSPISGRAIAAELGAVERTSAGDSDATPRKLTTASLRERLSRVEATPVGKREVARE